MKSTLGKLSAKEIEAITRKTMRKSNVPLVVSKPAQIFLDEKISARVEVLSAVEGVPSDQFILKLLKDDIDRLWKKYRKAI